MILIASRGLISLVAELHNSCTAALHIAASYCYMLHIAASYSCYILQLHTAAIYCSFIQLFILHDIGSIILINYIIQYDPSYENKYYLLGARLHIREMRVNMLICGIKVSTYPASLFITHDMKYNMCTLLINVLNTSSS